MLSKTTQKSLDFKGVETVWTSFTRERTHRKHAIHRALNGGKVSSDWATIRHPRGAAFDLLREDGSWKLRSAFATRRVASRPEIAVEVFAKALAGKDVVTLFSVLSKRRRNGLSTILDSLSLSLSRELAEKELAVGAVGKHRAEVHWEDQVYEYRIWLQKEDNEWRIDDIDLRRRDRDRPSSQD